MRFRRLQLFPLVFAFATLAGCGASSDSTGPKPDAAFLGIYKLKTVNGADLPYTTDQTTGSTTQVTDDQITFNADGTFAETATYRLTENGTPSTFQSTWSGVFVQSEDSVQLVYMSGASGSLSGSVASGTLTLTDADQTYVYTK